MRCSRGQSVVGIVAARICTICVRCAECGCPHSRERNEGRIEPGPIGGGHRGMPARVFQEDAVPRNQTSSNWDADDDPLELDDADRDESSEDEGGEGGIRVPPQRDGNRSVTLTGNRHPRFWVPGRLERKRNPLTRLVAVEIEVAGYDRSGHKLNQVCDRWGAAIVGDGSLPEGGFEVNTAPAGGDLWVRQIEEMCEALTTMRAYVNGRCGLHCHVDARDFQAYDLRRLVKLYSKLENSLYALLPPERRANTYCRPCAKQFLRLFKDARLPGSLKRVSGGHQRRSAIRALRRAQRGQVEEALYTPGQSMPAANAPHGDQQSYRDALMERKRRKYDGTRYNALNVHSYFFRGTIECRMHPGTVDPRNIINWGTLWAGILQYALITPERIVESLPDCRGDVSRGVQILMDIAPTPGAREYVEDCFRMYNDADVVQAFTAVREARVA